MSNRKGWELTFEEKTLDEAKNCDVEIQSVKDDEIIAEVDGFEVIVPILFHSPHYVMCNCTSRYPCRHQAAAVYYIEEHQELLGGGPNPSDMINSVDENRLREFLIREIDENPQFKKDFLDEFGQTVIDRDYYRAKLDSVFRTGEDSDFNLHGIRNIDMMSVALSDFMDNDLPKILKMGEHSFACMLVGRIAEILDDDLAVSHDSWYDLAEELMEWVYILEDSIYLTADERRSLERSVGDIVGYL